MLPRILSSLEEEEEQPVGKEEHDVLTGFCMLCMTITKKEEMRWDEMIKMVLAGSSDDVQQHCGTLSTQFIGFGFGGSRLQSYFYYVFFAASASAQPG